jgi:polysaccharide export outer membrane protein
MMWAQSTPSQAPTDAGGAQVNDFQSQGNAPPAQETFQPPRPTIGPGDVLNVQVFDTPELSIDTARVGQNGQVSLPVLGLVSIAGLNPEQAARQIESDLRTRGIMIEPHVTVSVVEYATQAATLLGEVKGPGVYPTFGGRRLLDLIAMAGGLSASAGKVVTIAHRDDPEHPVTVMLVPNAEALGEQKNPVILPGDTIMVSRAGIVYILGAVTRPGGYLVDNNEHVSLMDALTLAGGWTQTAGLSGARLIRKVPEGHKELSLDLKHVLKGKQADIEIENGDILYVPVSFGKTLGYRGMEAVIAAAQTAVVYSGSGNL